jgi:GNAT superfamily N-acetyltransferase
MLKYIEVKSPQAIDYQQTINYCQLVFDLSNYEVREITQKLLDSSSIAPNEMHYIVLKENDQTVGFAVYYYLTPIRLGYLDFLAVLPEFRCRGLGSKLYQQVVNELKVKHPDIEGLILEAKSTDDVEQRRDFFIKQGACELKLGSFQIPQQVKDSGLLLMYQPLTKEAEMDSKLLTQAFRVLAETLWH